MRPIVFKSYVWKFYLNLTDEQSVVFAEIIILFQDVFAKNEFDTSSFNEDIKHRIDTGDAKTVRQNTKNTLMLWKRRKRTVRKMFDTGNIVKSSSDWPSSSILGRKKDKFRALIKVTTKDVFPLPNMNDCFES